MEFGKIVDSRRSVREFYDKKPDWKDIIEAIDAARKAPLAGNIGNLKFIIVDEPELISNLAEAAQQDFVGKVHYIVVVCSDKTDLVRSYDERGEKYAQQQAGASIENFLLKIIELGLGSCWVGAFVDEQVKIILKIPANIDVIAILPIGYPRHRGEQKRKPPLDRCLYFNRYKMKFMKPRSMVQAR